MTATCLPHTKTSTLVTKANKRSFAGRSPSFSDTSISSPKEASLSAKLDPNPEIKNELVVNEEHFSPEEGIANSGKSTPPAYSSILKKPSDIKYSAELHCCEQKQKDFLKEHDLSEHYVWAWAGENSCFIHGDDQYLQIIPFLN